MAGNILIRKLSFFGRKSIREYIMGKSWALHGFFSYVGESRIKTGKIERFAARR